MLVMAFVGAKPVIADQKPVIPAGLCCQDATSGPVEAAETRRRVFDMIASERLPFIGDHMPLPAVGFVEKQGEGYRFVPVSCQLDI